MNIEIRKRELKKKKNRANYVRHLAISYLAMSKRLDVVEI